MFPFAEFWHHLCVPATIASFCFLAKPVYFQSGTAACRIGCLIYFEGWYFFKKNCDGKYRQFLTWEVLLPCATELTSKRLRGFHLVAVDVNKLFSFAQKDLMTKNMTLAFLPFPCAVRLSLVAAA